MSLDEDIILWAVVFIILFSQARKPTLETSCPLPKATDECETHHRNTDTWTGNVTTRPAASLLATYIREIKFIDFWSQKESWGWMQTIISSNTDWHVNPWWEAAGQPTMPRDIFRGRILNPVCSSPFYLGRNSNFYIFVCF